VLPEITLQQDLHIGGRSDTANIFSFVNDLYVDERGDIYVTDNFDEGVRIFDSTGAFMRRFGTKGEGPDKIPYPDHVAVAGDTVFLPGVKALRLFDTHGRWIRTVRSRINVPILDVVHSPDGLLVSVSRPWVDRLGVMRGEFWACFTVLTADALGWGECPLHYDRAPVYSYGIGSRALPFVVNGSIALSPGGFLFGAAGTDYVVDLATRAEVIHIRHNSPRVPVTKGDIDKELDRIREELSTDLGLYEHLGVRPNGPMRFAPPTVLDDHAKVLPKFRPVISRLVAGPEGELVVRRQDLSTDEATVWDYIDSSHEAVGRFSVPRKGRFILRRLVGCAIYGVILDELDVPSIVRYRLSAPCAAP
jgi:hypothetical protein